ncbi:uncharacterized protein LOC144139540 [Haemaphysalis longicornis]
MASDPYFEIVTVIAALVGVVVLIALLWLLVRKFVLGRSAQRPAEKEAAQPGPATQQEAAAVASPAQPPMAITPGGKQAAGVTSGATSSGGPAGVTSGATSAEGPAAKRRSIGDVARRASLLVSQAVKQETTALLESLSAGAISAQVPKDEDLENKDNTATKPGSDAAPPKDDATAGTKATSPSPDRKGNTKPSPSTQFISDGNVAEKPGREKKDPEAAVKEAPRAADAAEKEKQGLPGGDDPGELQATTATPASPSSGGRGTEEQVSKEPTKSKGKKRKKGSAPGSSCTSPSLEKPDVQQETSVTHTKRKHKRNPDMSAKSPTETSGKDTSSADAEQSSAAALPSTHA